VMVKQNPELVYAKWRKRVGVEPTKDRLTTLTGFEVRPPHRGTHLFHEHVATVQ
jgi:hypothetical protein